MRDATARPHRRGRLRAAVLFLAAASLAIMSAMVASTTGAGAQEREPVDLELSMTNREDGFWNSGFFRVSVKNNSDVTVYDIRVQLEIDDLTAGRTIFLLEHEPGSVRIDSAERWNR